MKKLVSDIQIAIREELCLMGKDMEIRIGCVISSLIKRYQKEIDARKRLHNKLVEMNGNLSAIILHCIYCSKMKFDNLIIYKLAYQLSFSILISYSFSR